MNANKDIYKKSTGKVMSDQEGFNMVEVIVSYTGWRVGPTFFHGSKLINGIWATGDVAVSSCVMPAGYRSTNHCVCVVALQDDARLIGASFFYGKQSTS